MSAAKDEVAVTTDVYDLAPLKYAAQWDGYTPAADDYDLVGLLTGALAGSSGVRILDIGSGSGRDMKRMSSLGFKVQGLDTSAELAKLASAHGEVSVGDMRAMPFEDDEFDGALAQASLLHLNAADGLTALSEIKRIVRSGGYVSLSVKKGNGDSVDRDGRFFHFYTDDELDAVIAASGFKIVHAATDTTGANGTVWLVRLIQA